MQVKLIIDCSFIMSILTFVSTLCIAVMQYKLNQKISKKQLGIVFFNQTFLEHLTKKLPKVREMLRFDPNTHFLTDADPLIEELNQIRRDAFYFRYLNEAFYNKLMKALQDFEDFLVQNVEKKYYDKEMQSECNETIKSYITNIYSIIHEAYDI